jgi:NADH:ubiquinone oxidoreductase subunit 2 (subunit N)
VADAVAAFRAGILAAMGVVILLAGRAGQADVLSGVLCGAALVLAAGTLGFSELRTRDGVAPSSAGNQTVASPEMIAKSSTAASRPFAIEDRLSRSATWLALLLGLLAAVATVDGGSSHVCRRLAILLLSLSGVLLAAVANDLVLAVMAMELASLPATVLLFVERDAPHARTAALRSLALNIFALAMLVAGAALIALVSGTTNLEDLRSALPHAATVQHVRTLRVESPIAAAIGCVLLLAGFGVHFLAAPFQLAAAEIFDGAKAWGVGLTALFPRGAALLLLIRVLVNGPPRLQGTAQTLFTAVGFLTMLIGGLLVVSQSRIRRLLAFMVVFQSGLILAALAAGCSERARPAATPWLGTELPGGVGSACLCFALDALALVGLLALIGLRERTDRPLDEVEQLVDAVRGDRVRAGALCVLAASLAGLPPFAGFWPRLAILRSMLSISVPAENGFLPHQNVDYVVVAIAAAGGLIVLAAVVLGLVKKVLLDDLDAPRVEILRGDRSSRANASEKGVLAVGQLAALAVVLLGIFPGPATRAAARGTADEYAVNAASADQGASLPAGRKAVRRRGQAPDEDDD